MDIDSDMPVSLNLRGIQGHIRAILGSIQRALGLKGGGLELNYMAVPCLFGGSLEGSYRASFNSLGIDMR